MDRNDLLRRGDLLDAYDAAHKGPPGGARKLIEEAPARVGWISVKDRLPKKNKYVLTVFANGEMVVACVFECDEDVVYWRAQTDMGWETDMDFDPTHWMSLPEPPKVE